MNAADPFPQDTRAPIRTVGPTEVGHLVECVDCGWTAEDEPFETKGASAAREHALNCRHVVNVVERYRYTLWPEEEAIADLIERGAV